MSRHWLRAVLLLSTLALLGFGSRFRAVNGFEPSASPRVATSFPLSDTLRSSTDPDSPLILSLPAELQDRPVTHYRVLRAPSLSGVASQSFTWIPEDADPGTYDARLHAHHPDAAPDTLVVRITVDS